MDLQCVFHSYILHPDEYNGYGILRVRVAPGSYAVCEPLGCAIPPNLTGGTPLMLTGDYREGRQFTYPCDGELSFLFTEIVQTMPMDEASAVEFIESMQIRGIANANSRHIISITGPDMESYFRNNPDASDFKSKIPSLTLPAAEAFIRRIMTTTTQKHLLDFMHPYGVTYSDVFKLYKEITKDIGRECTMDEALDLLKPHKMTAEGRIPNGCYYYCSKAEILFDATDMVAKALDYRAYHPERLRYLTYQAMQSLQNRGHIWSSLEHVYNECNMLTKRSAFPNNSISKWAIYAAVKTTPWWFVEENCGERIYLESSWFDERNVVSNVRRIQATNKVLPYYETIINEIEQERGFKFSEAQRKCFEFLKESGIRIVTGGAGTGKTTVISGLLMAYTRLNPKNTVALCAPTGRAAQRMTELCATYGANVRAYTIHKLLDFAPFNGEAVPSFDETNPLPADMIIVDEMSMVDLHLFALLVKAVKDGALVILCGDVHQLPSVAAGRVFWDLIESNKFQTVRLTANYRQAGGGNSIIDNANKINDGNANLIGSKDFEIIPCSTDLEMRNKVVDLVTQNQDQTVLTTIRKNNAGVNELNKALQPIINTSVGNSMRVGSVEFRENDHIIMTHNNYDVGYVNGDVGIVKSIDHGALTVQLGTEERVIERDNLRDVSLAYALTIHKSQGSEYDSVIVVLPASAPHMLVRNLLYTAVTRAKKHVTIIGEPASVKRAVANIRNTNRRTTLKELLCA